MTFLDFITLFNWVVIAILFVLVAISILFPTPGGDAAGRGMGQAIIFLTVVLLVIMAVLNLLPFQWAKYVAFVFIALPITLFVLSRIWHRVKYSVANRIAQFKPVFPDKERDRAARAIYKGNPEQLRKILQNPMPRLNEGGNMLILAINATSRLSDKPEERLECVRLLFQAGARLDRIDDKDASIHLSTAGTGNADLQRLLLENGADAKYFQIEKHDAP